MTDTRTRKEVEAELIEALAKLPRRENTTDADWAEEVAHHARVLVTYHKTGSWRDTNWDDTSARKARNDLAGLHKRLLEVEKYLSKCNFNQDAIISMALAGAFKNSPTSVSEYKANFGCKLSQVEAALADFVTIEQKTKPKKRHARHVAKAVVNAYEDLTGKRATTIYSDAAAKRRGHLVALMTSVFSTLLVKASGASMAQTLIGEANEIHDA